MWKLSDILLRKVSKATNTTSPHSDYIHEMTYPEQDADLLNTIVTMHYNSHYRHNIADLIEPPAIKIEDGHIVSTRPKDDYQFLTPRHVSGTDIAEAVDVKEGEFRILRADKTAPFVLIAISTDYEQVLVSSTEFNEMHHYKFLDEPSIYPTQKTEFYNIALQTHYMDENYINDVYYDAIALRVDATDPALTVLMEYIDEDTVRFVLGDEVTGIDNSKFDEENYISDKMIAEYRQSLLEGKIIYGTV